MMRFSRATLVLTVLNEEASIARFMDSLLLQSVMPKEIVIVDGGSNDNTVGILRSWQAPAGCTVVISIFASANISEGRNEAIQKASNELILVTDAGTALSPKWVELMAAGFESANDVDVVSGFFLPDGEGFWERTIAFAITPELREIDPASFLPSSRSVAFTVKAWEAAGGYPEWLDYCEDLIFDLSLKRQGSQFVFQPEATVTWSGRPSLAGFIKQYYRYARGDGKAGLWAKRHAIRYLAYVGGLAILSSSWSLPLLLVLLPLGAAAYLQKSFRRVWSRRVEFGSHPFAALLMVPVVVVAGDIAKMVGYPVGLVWKRNHRERLGNS